MYLPLSIDCCFSFLSFLPEIHPFLNVKKPQDKSQQKKGTRPKQRQGKPEKSRGKEKHQTKHADKSDSDQKENIGKSVIYH